jgi:acetoin utilization deacetylase AcuC-like enzyme
MKIFYSPVHRDHNPPFEIFDGGEKVANFEVPERAERILAALDRTRWAEILAPTDFGLEPIRAVHDEAYLDFLRTAHEEWSRQKGDSPTDYANIALLPATFPPAGWRHRPESLLGRAGYYMMDLSAPIVAGTYRAALGAADCALSAAQAASESSSAAFALCRPPGHHAGRANCGGYCYINNAAVAANWLTARGRVALLDVDYHAANGTQDIFYARGDVLTISIHADPAQEYPYFCGYADETGAGAGAGCHRNFPLPAGTGDQTYLKALEEALTLVRQFAPTTLVLSIGMDIYEADPLGEFRVTREGIRAIGRRVAGLGLPTVIVMEGGYNNDALGENVVAMLEPFANSQ